MKVLHVEGGRNLYGGPHQILLLMRGLRERGIDNVLACREASELARAAVGLAEVHGMHMAGDLDTGLIGRLYRLIRKTRPDIVHLHSRIGADVMGGIAARLAGVRVVHSRRQDNPERRLAVALKYRLHDRVIAISEGISRVLMSEGLPPGKLRCVRDAIDIPPLATPRPEALRREFGLDADALVIGVVAQLIHRKGHHVLLEAMPRVLENFPRARVLFFGKGPLEPVLQAHIERRDLTGVVRFAGFREDLEHLLPSLDLVVHPALMEGLGVSLLQASGACLPIVATRVGGIPEAVSHGVTGWLVEPGDAPALADAVVHLLGNPDLRRQLGQAGRRWVQDRFSAERMVEGNLAVYRELLA